MKKFLLCTYFLILSTSLQAWTHPVSYQGATSLMSYNKSSETEWMLNHSLRSYFAIGIQYYKTDKFEMNLARANLLAQRWNNEDSQGNIYLSAGQGVENSLGESKSVTMGSVEADWESRKYYTSIQYNKFLRENSGSTIRPDYETTKGRLGVAPYLADFNEINSWLILQFDKTNQESIETTQFIRLFYKNTLIELGARVGGGWAFNYMMHF